MKVVYREIIMGNGKKAMSFIITTRKGYATGLFDGKICIHSIMGRKCLKGIMSILVNKFGTNKVIFTPLITDAIGNKVKGKVKIIKSNNPENPYGEDIKCMECEWK